MDKKVIFCALFLFFFKLSIGLCGSGEWIEPLDDNSTWINWTKYSLYTELNGTSSELYPDYINLKREKIHLMNKLYNATLNFEIKKGLQIQKLIDKRGKELLWEEINTTKDNYMIKTSINSYKLTMGINILGPFLKHILPLSLLLREPDVDSNTIKKENYIKGYTGVIIEVSTDKFKPSLLIYLYSKNGELLFSPKLTDYDTLINKGMALYLSELNGQAKDRIGEHPLFLHADSIYNNNEHSLVLDENSDFYLKFENILELLKKGKLVISKKTYSTINQDQVNEFNIEN
ncbi:hypothetical protein JCM13304A_03990 [Desulfothermus okinawensis JCM 13304]